MSVRDLALELPLAGVQLIEASAGTGKTFTLAGLFARLVVECGLSVRQILVVTYTNAAAAELRSRLRERLLLCGAIARDINHFGTPDPVPFELEQCLRLVTAARAREGDLALQRRLRLAALELDVAQISTIHGFCLRALAEHAVLGAAAVAGELVPTDRDLIATIAADFWRAQAVAVDAQAYAALVQVVQRVDALAALLPLLLDDQQRLLPAPTLDPETAREALAAADRALAAIGETWREQGVQAFAALRDHAAAGNINARSYALARIAQDQELLAQALSAGADSPLALLQRYSAHALEAKRNKGKPALVPQRFFERIADALPALQSALAARRALGLDLLRACVVEARERIETIKRDSARFSYDDLIRRLHLAIGGTQGEGLAAALHTQYPCALVDEFQDTDARQFEIFSAIYRDRGSLFLIGDPKQAIYRFRGGDIYAYLAARERATARHALDTNFRSSPGYLRALEQVYRFAGADAFADKRIEFHPLHAGGGTADDDLQINGRPALPLTFWHFDAEADARPNKADALHLLAHGCASAVVDLLVKARAGMARLRSARDKHGRDHRQLQPGDLALLVNTHREADAMQSALAERGVPSVCVSKRSVFASDEARELHLLLDALTQFDDARLRSVLATLLFGQSLGELDAMRTDAERWRAQIGIFAELRRVWAAHGVLAMLERVFEQRAAALLAIERGERRLTNWLQLADLAQTAAPHAFGMRGLADWLGQRIASADDDNEDEQLRLESDSDRVQVLTLHASKGLEYPIVFLPFAPLRTGTGNAYPQLHRYHDAAGRPSTYWVTDSAAADESAAIAACTAERGESLGERLRVLYVGLTRARCACYVATGVFGQAGAAPALNHLLRLADDADAASLRERLRALAGTAADVIALTPLPPAGTSRLRPEPGVRLVPARQATRSVRSTWRTYSFSQLHASSGAVVDDVAGTDDEPGVFDAAPNDTLTAIPAALRGARFGSAFHEILEYADFGAWRDWRAATAPVTEQALVERVLRRHGLIGEHGGEAARQSITRLLAATLNSPLPAGTRLVDLAPGSRRAELPFHFAIGDADAGRWLGCMRAHGYLPLRARFALESDRLGGLMSGVIDLVFVHNQRWWLVDYKTNLLGVAASDYQPTQLAGAVRDSEYDLQYLIYLVALHRWLKLRLGAAYDYARDVGGALYLFVRGLDGNGIDGIHHDRPPQELIEALDAFLAPSREAAA